MKIITLANEKGGVGKTTSWFVKSRGDMDIRSIGEQIARLAHPLSQVAVRQKMKIAGLAAGTDLPVSEIEADVQAWMIEGYTFDQALGFVHETWIVKFTEGMTYEDHYTGE